jgi:hypothetical protein
VEKAGAEAVGTGGGGGYVCRPSRVVTGRGGGCRQ